MKHAIALLLALVCAASAQTYKTVTADTNNSIRTNFTITGAKVSGTVATASNVTGVVAISNGGTGASTASNALAALLPSYASNAGKVLTVKFGDTGVEWSTNSGGGGGVTAVNVSGGSTGLTFSGGPISNSGTITMGGTLMVTNGGTGATNALNALINLKVLKDSGTVMILGTNSGGYGVVIGAASESASSASHSVVIGHGGYVGNDYGIAIGNGAYTDDKDDAGYAGVAISPNGGIQGLGGAVGYSSDVYGDGGAIGLQTYTEDGGAIGKWAYSTHGFAGGYDSTANGTNNIQLGQGTNDNEYTIQIYSAGSVGTNSWNALANSSAGGRYAMTNTAGISSSKTFVAYDGTNYTTNTVTFSNGIITGWTP